jgi:hypothetical protein
VQPMDSNPLDHSDGESLDGDDYYDEYADDPPFRPRPRKVTNCSVVYSIRLGPDEVRELQFRAGVVGMPPAMLARQFVRRGLLEEDDVAGDDEAVTALVYRIARDSAALRRLLRVDAPAPALS